MVSFKVTSKMMDSMPVGGNYTTAAGQTNFNVHTIDLGSVLDVNTNMTLVQDNSPKDFFMKKRVVSCGIRFFKTSKSDTESGV